ncbi:MAG: excinuclease ABC subunit UvrA [Moraxellaceae bacterium]|nr:excinuclease ABC subunit UvrA [Pseudobdellovibrionaceae bacterium]
MKSIHVWGIKQNNLKNIEVKIPLGEITVICGPSGSGKSSLAFETLFAEGQRRFIESMSNYARQFLNKAPKPDIEGINNIPPAISIEQKNTIKSSRSTVGTTTELIDYLRLLYEKIATPYCPEHHTPMTRQSTTEATDLILEKFKDKRGYILVEIPKEGRVVDGKKLHALLLQDGYLRAATLSSKLAVEIIEISEPAQIKKGLPKDSFYIVIDRLQFSGDEKGRLTDSLTQAYDTSIKYIIGQNARRALIITSDGEQLKLCEEISCAICGKVSPQITSKLFAFNSPIGACPKCKGFGNILELDENKVIPNSNLSISEGAINPFTMPSAEQDKKALFAYCKKQKISLQASWKDLPKVQRDLLWNGSKEFFGVKGLFEYLEQMKYKMHVRVFISRYRSGSLCPECHGSRLRKEVQNILIDKKPITYLSALTIDKLQEFFENVKLTAYQEEVAGEVLKQVKSRLNFLMRVGVSYLTLDRETRTLSGGEYQRLILANQLGMGLSQTLYVLDEPTVGLHPRDNDRLISILKDLKNLGNTLVIVEHDHDVIKNAENIIEMGPGSGYLGGEVVFAGKADEFFKSKNSNTAQYIMTSSHKFIQPKPVDITKFKYKIELTGCEGNNLKKIDVAIPLNRLVVVTGVSGSGKSTLITKTLYPALAKKLEIDFLPIQKFSKIYGDESIKNVLLVDQSAIGKSARSSPITYLKAFDNIRNLMASVPEAKQRGYTPGTFSLNVDGGRCPSCRGTGFEEIDMQFMDNVIIPCDVCDSKKYRQEILEIMLNGKNVHQILSMTVAEAMNFFVAHPNIRKPLSVLKEVGLDYLTLGQPASTLSGGESQRLKIAKELSQVSQKSTLYILDEPTTGLHFKEIELLMNVLHKLIEAGGSVVVVEHNMDVIKNADYVIDMGPDAGAAGGEVVFAGSPMEMIKAKKSLTGQYLKRYLGVN